jgi:tRNA-dependent cyclodipeptide synthase
MKGFNYPTPTGKYKVTIVNGGGWQQQKRCRIQMSLRNPKYEDDKLYGILEWASARFEQIDFILSDTLLRHNLMFEKGITEEKAHLESLRLGDEWLERNRVHFLGFKNINIVRWDQCLSMPIVNTHIKKLKNACSNYPEFRNNVNNVVNGFWSRKYNDNGIYELFATNGINYLIEELSVFGVLFKDSAIDVYAGEWVSGCIESVNNIGIIESYNNAHYLEIDLVRNKAFQNEAA